MNSVTAFAPGRVNLIGEHTDYNGGLALAFAIEQGVTVTAEEIPGNTFEVAAAGFGADRFDLGSLIGTEVDDWRAYVRGVAMEIAADAVSVPAVRIAIESDLAPGVGLGSSAALCVATALALLQLAGEPADELWVASIATSAENEWANAHTGSLDQLASLLGREGEAVALNFDDLPTWRRIRFDLGGARLVVIPSGASRELAASGYNQRRLECEQRHPARLRHVKTENERVRRAIDALETGDTQALGALLDASHASLRDDFEVSVPEVERTVAEAKAAGALGARIMGGGFGGSVLALFGPGTLPAKAIPVAPATGGRVVRP